MSRPVCLKACSGPLMTLQIPNDPPFPLRLIPQYSLVLIARTFSFGQQSLTCFFVAFMCSNLILKLLPDPASVQNVAKYLKVKKIRFKELTDDDSSVSSPKLYMDLYRYTSAVER
jgi:hypothetical protein